VAGASHEGRSLAGRLFLAIWPDAALLEALAPLDRWLARLGDYRVVAPKQRHVTAAFLGEVDETAAQLALESAQQLARRSPAFVARAQGLVALPDRSRPRVVALEFGDDAGALAQLLRRCVEELAELLATEPLLRAVHRGALAHMTLARARRQAQAPSLGSIQPPPVEASLEVRELHLVRSTLTPAGPVYETLARAPLAG